MIWGIIIASITILSLILKRDLWEKLLGLSSLSVKISALSALVAYSIKEGYLMDVTLMYIMASGAGTVLFLIFLMRSGME